MKRKTHAEYENQLFERELNFIPLEPYNGSFGYIDHQCINDHIWKVTPAMILNGSNCPYCSGKKTTTSDYQKEINHTGYTVLESYINRVTPIMHSCSCGNEWKARPDNIVNAGTGCPKCAKRGFDGSKPAIVYYIKITKNNETYFKVGITNKTVENRFKGDRDKQIEVIKTLTFDKGSEARRVEAEILSRFPRVTINDFLRVGNTELFEEDIGEENVRYY